MRRSVHPLPALLLMIRAKRKFKRPLQILGTRTLEEACEHAVLDFSGDVPEFATLVTIALVIPVNSVLSERGFRLL